METRRSRNRGTRRNRSASAGVASRRGILVPIHIWHFAFSRSIMPLLFHSSFFIYVVAVPITWCSLFVPSLFSLENGNSSKKSQLRFLGRTGKFDFSFKLCCARADEHTIHVRKDLPCRKPLRSSSCKRLPWTDTKTANNNKKYLVENENDGWIHSIQTSANLCQYWKKQLRRKPYTHLEVQDDNGVEINLGERLHDELQLLRGLHPEK